ncbi:MAG: hypothetical protein LBK29_01515 [Oscillospiraceae bacterium]|jgi:DNA polymerase-3 subunit delta|nr:hypothetical protein [Oscillospiraceae bacterium]
MPKISYIDLKKSIKSSKLGNFYYFFGKEKFLISYYTKKIIETATGSLKNSFGVKYFYEENMNLNNLSMFLEMFPVGSNKKCAVLRDPEIEDSNKEMFFKIISNIPDFSILIIQGFSDVNKNFKILENMILKFGFLVEFSDQNLPIEKQSILWAKKLGKVLSERNARLLSEICGRDLNNIKNNLEKICFSEKLEEISKENIESIINEQDYEYSVFEISKALNLKKYEMVFKIIENLILRKEEPVSILSVIAMQFIDAYRLKCAKLNGISVNKIFEIFDYKNKEFRIENSELNFKNYDIKIIEKCIKILIETDILLKSTQISRKLLLDEMLVKLIKINIAKIKTID